MAESEPENLFVVNSCFVKYLFLSKGLAAEIMVNVSQSKFLMNVCFSNFMLFCIF